MKKKGFTLIELLAVIVILAIIAIIAIPIIASVVEKSREGAARDGGYNYIRAVETRIATNKLDNSIPDIVDGIYSVADLKDTYKVQVKGNAPTAGEVTIEKGKITECVLTIDKYTFTCNGNELVKSEDQAMVLGDRMKDSDVNKAYYQHLFDITPYSYEVGSEYRTYWDAYMAALESQKSYFIPDGWDTTIDVESIDTLTYIDLTNAIKSKDISQASNGSVMVWYTDTDNNSKYEMHIGQEGGVVGPVIADYLFTNSKAGTIDLSNMNTSFTTSMEGFFYQCKSVTAITFGNNFNTSRVTNMHGMFSECEALESLDLSKFNTSKVKDMGFMFNYCRQLTNINLSSFNTSNVTNMEAMFQNCSKATNINVSSFNTAKVKDMSYMFSSCMRLGTLDLSSFNTLIVEDAAFMFQSTMNMEVIYKGCYWSLDKDWYVGTRAIDGIFRYSAVNELTLKPGLEGTCPTLTEPEGLDPNHVHQK